MKKNGEEAVFLHQQPPEVNRINLKELWNHSQLSTLKITVSETQFVGISSKRVVLWLEAGEGEAQNKKTPNTTTN